MAAGRTVAVVAQGLGDATPAEAERVVDGRALLPPTPVHLCLEGNSGAGIVARWIRRSRLGWGWIDGAEVPLGEEREAYLVEIVAGDGVLRAEEVLAPTWTYGASAIAVDGMAAGGVPLILRVRQRGIHGLGPAAAALLSF